MFKTVKRIIDWCGEYKKRLYFGFVLTFFIHIFSAATIMVAAFTLGKMIKNVNTFATFDKTWIVKSFIIILALVILKFIFMFIKAKCQEPIGYHMVAKNRLEVGESLKRVSLGYFNEMNTGNILNSITTGLNTLETMGVRMIDNFVGGYINFLVIFIGFLFMNPTLSSICIAAVLISFVFLLIISHFSTKNTPKEAKSNSDLTKSALEYARGLPTVKSFGQNGVSFNNIKNAISESKKIHLKIEWGFIPSNCLHLLALKFGSIVLAGATCILGFKGKMDITTMLAFILFSFNIFGSIEPISDSAHLLSVMDDAMNQLKKMKKQTYLDENSSDISLSSFDINFKNVDFSYDSRKVLNNINFDIKEKTTTAIIGPSGSGKSTICNLLARFYDVDSGNILVGGHNIKELTCDSLLKNISMVFQNVYLFNDTIRSNICFGKPDATKKEMIEASKKACCHDFIMQLPNGYDTIVGEGGGTLSGGEKQRISIARAILKDSPIIILDEATASIDPENEHYIQEAISELTKNKTIITIAHRLATIENADQILVVDNGQIVQKGTHEELIFTEGKYKQFIKIRELAEGWKIA